MINLSLRIWFVFLTLVLLLAGCHFSFHSNQYQMVKGILSQDQNDLDGGGWRLVWSGYDLLVSPVVVGEEIWFVGPGNLVIRFDGWQIVGVDNLFPVVESASAKLNGARMSLVLGNKITGVFECDAWIDIEKVASGQKNFRQKCSSKDRDFVNEIGVNENGSITELNFTMHPNYPPILLLNL